ncbi:UNVERIFIED_CONTAM: Polygalacturonate 4-alpha-galacturonosyltransferase [Sesamum latifolium]|uniref:Hexosyltransferase n=1 Tax=Sesamum latifolium TaxID=2727402 RepID=A0AAW2VSC5_9LAMI
MATERGLFFGVRRNKAIGSLFTIAFLIFFSSFLAFSFLFIGRGLLTASSTDKDESSTDSSGQSTGVASYAKQETSKAKQDEYNEDHSSFLEKPSKLPRRQLRGKRRENQTADLVKQDYEVTVKLENEPIKRSKSVDSAVLGKYSLWRKQNENENSDSNVRAIQDQMIMARVYISLAITKNKLDLAHELQNRLRDSQRSLGEATTDSHLHRSAPEMMKAMDVSLSKARERLYSCKVVTEKLRAMLQSADEQVRTLKKQSTFLSQLAAKTIPNGLHCLSMRLTIDYYLLPPKNRKFPRSENLENPNLYHYALFSDNVLAASVVVNSTIMNAKNEDRVLWKLGTLPPGLMTFYGLTHPLQKSWHVLGLGYNPSVNQSEIQTAAVIHYNGNMKPWLELAMTTYRAYWTKYINYGHPYIRNCKLSE